MFSLTPHGDTKLGETLDLGEVYVNGKSALTQLVLENLSAEELVIKVSIEDDALQRLAAIGFQLSNENLQLMDSDGPFTIKDLSSQSHNFNEIFNEICHVDQIVLTPHEKCVVTMTFKPANLDVQPDWEGRDNAGDSDGDESQSSTLAFEVAGDIKFCASCVQLPALPDPERILRIKASACRSILNTDVDQLHFNDCVPNETYVKDFTVWNRCEISLWFRVAPYAADAHNATKGLLEFSEYDTNRRLRTDGKWSKVPAHAQLRIRVTFKAKEVGARDFRIDIENMNNVHNTKRITIHSAVNLVSTESQR